MEDGSSSDACGKTKGRKGRPVGSKKRKRAYNFHKTPSTTANGPQRKHYVSAESKQVHSLQKEAVLSQMACSSVYDHSGCTRHRDWRNRQPENLDSVTTVLFEAVDAVEEADEPGMELR